MKRFFALDAVQQKSCFGMCERKENPSSTLKLRREEEGKRDQKVKKKKKKGRDDDDDEIERE